MTRMPDLERELVAAAQRRFAPSHRRRGWLARMRPWRLAPVAAVLLVAVVAGAAMRGGSDPELEAPPRPANPAPTLKELRSGPVGPLLEYADPSVRPVSLRAGEYTVVAWGEEGGHACFSAARANAAGYSCASAGRLAMSLPGSGGTAGDWLGDDGKQIVYGLARGDVEAIDVEIGETRKAAVLDDRLLTVEVTETERRAIELDGGKVPPAGPISLRLFAAILPDDERSRGMDATLHLRRRGRQATRTDARGVAIVYEVSTHCYREPKLDNTEFTERTGLGSPVTACREFWDTRGFRGTPKPERLAACINRDGQYMVFPAGPGICKRLGLQP